MGTAIILVAVAAAIGVGLVVFGTVRSQQAASPQESVRASYRTLADVREQPVRSHRYSHVDRVGR